MRWQPIGNIMDGPVIFATADAPANDMHSRAALGDEGPLSVTGYIARAPLHMDRASRIAGERARPAYDAGTAQ